MAEATLTKRSVRRVLLGVIALILVATLGVGGFYLWSVNQALSAMPREDLMPSDDPVAMETQFDEAPNLGVPAPEGGDAAPADAAEADAEGAIPPTNENIPPIEGGVADPGGTVHPGRPDVGAAGSLNYLLLGSDSRGSDRGRSDVMMVAHVPPTRDKVYLISFTRDMWVTIPGRGAAKINAGYAYGGVPLAVRTVENLIGTRIDHAVMINFTGFSGLTAALGGVTVNNQHATPGYPKGQITISGDEALKYVRERYNLPNGDLGRAQRQRAVVQGILTKMLSADVLANPAKFNQVVGQLGGFFTVDAGLTNQTIFEMATSVRVRGMGDLVSLQAPIAGFGRSRGGQAINLVDWPKMRQMSEAIRTGTMHSYAG